jgi:hypothetical protein
MPPDMSWQYKMMQKGFLLYLSDIIHDVRTVAFLIGMGFEAAGLTIQSALGYPIIPAIDAIVAIGLGLIIILYVKREKRAK